MLYFWEGKLLWGGKANNHNSTLDCLIYADSTVFGTAGEDCRDPHLLRNHSESLQKVAFVCLIYTIEPIPLPKL